MFETFPAKDADGVSKDERVALEEPLQITLDGRPIAVVMRSPGNDGDLVMGFLITEGIIPDLQVIRKLDLESRPNHALVFLREDFVVDVSRLQRNFFSASSCGVCGKATIEGVMSDHPPLAHVKNFHAEAVLGAPDKLRKAQAAFEATGGIHAAGLYNESGNLLIVREDVGRHNAVDKVVGAALQGGLDTSECFLLVSGRVSFEIMQKALVAAIPLVAAISAPSSLAVQFANQSGQMLVAFLRPPRYNVYAGRLS